MFTEIVTRQLQEAKFGKCCGKPPRANELDGPKVSRNVVFGAQVTLPPEE